MVSIDYDISVSIDLEDWEQTAFNWIAAILFFGGLIAGAVHLVDPHPILPYVAGGGLVVGAGMLIAFGDGEDMEAESETAGFDETPLTAKAGYLAGIVGVAVLAIGVTTPQPFTEVAAGGFTLLITGVIVTGYFDPDVTMDDDTDANAVPDDPTEMLDDGDDE